LAEAEKPKESTTGFILRWGGILLIAIGITVLFTSYLYVPLDVWSGGAPWNPATWQYHVGSVYYANGWLGIIPLVIGVVMYVAGKMMKPKERV